MYHLVPPNSRYFLEHRNDISSYTLKGGIFRGTLARAGVVVHGDVRVNGVSADSSYMRRHSGFMHQEDMFIETMTVLEHIWFMARMKLDRRIHTSDIRLRIDRLLRNVGLLERRDTCIGGGDDHKVLSGGEKKRLAFATELLTDPEILFLDEPTTGQDAHSAGVLVSHMTSFALRNRTILCTIHQPSSTIFDSFHRIILLAGGRVAFAGTSAQALQFFSRYYFITQNMKQRTNLNFIALGKSIVLKGRRYKYVLFRSHRDQENPKYYPADNISS
ncbi:PREDICTED: protein scarlet-like [Wasmannia auropunctata]|uniref:protein scarlet-like n=1 Tax=Wasmannia auropunctata TaxID=64793 RepID=UPI0005F01149|nr:PREDICTED: protein scarlet-like [Wasmannia auropunctata]